MILFLKSKHSFLLNYLQTTYWIFVMHSTFVHLLKAIILHNVYDLRVSYTFGVVWSKTLVILKWWPVVGLSKFIREKFWRFWNDSCLITLWKTSSYCLQSMYRIMKYIPFPPSQPPLVLFCATLFLQISSIILTTSRCSYHWSPASLDLLACAHLRGLRPRPCPPHYLLSPCEYFALLLPLVRDAWDWVLIVFPWCGHCGMRLPDVWCVVTGVWPLTPSRPPACLPVRLHLTGGDTAGPTHTDAQSRLPHTSWRDTVTACVCAFIFSFMPNCIMNNIWKKFDLSHSYGTCIFLADLMRTLFGMFLFCVFVFYQNYVIWDFRFKGIIICWIHFLHFFT